MTGLQPKCTQIDLGKTTMLLQYLKFRIPDRTKALYVTADHHWFYDQTLFDLAGAFVRMGGTHLLIDEIHKYPAWSRELKNIYDGLPDLQVIFTASSILDILKGEYDLSRRAITYELTGLSFREFLELFHEIRLPVQNLDRILTSPDVVTREILDRIKPLPLFREFLEFGYFPFAHGEKSSIFRRKLDQIITTVLDSDLMIVEGYTAAHIAKIKKLLGVIAGSVPFEPNISALARKLQIGRDTVKIYLHNLERARLLNLVTRDTDGVASLQKPEKIYPENTNLSFALKDHPELGTLRETFFLNQLRNAGHSVHLPRKGDFLIDRKWIFEIGGARKGNHKIRDLQNGFLALDDMEHAYLNRIPLWLFGFLY